MTQRSTYERATQAVVNAAYELIDAPFYWDLGQYNGDHHARERKLREAVNAHRELGLQHLSPRAAQSNNSTDTSAQAGASLGDVSGLARTCFDEITLAGGLTTYQLTQVLGREHQTVSARVNDLLRKGWVVDSGLRRKTGSGRNACVWKPSALALKETQ